MHAVTDQDDRVVVEPNGSIHVDGASLGSRLRNFSGRYQLLTDVPGLLVLRSDAVREDRATRALMAGEVVSRMTIMEILNIVAQANWRGELHVFSGDSHRVLSLDQGVLKGATSNEIDDRLGEVMFRNGLLTRDALDEVLSDPRPDKRFGERCVERGLLDQTKLFEQLQKQAEAVFFSALIVSQGHYAFLLPPDTEGDARAATFHLPITGLLMEGVQRIDEMALFRDKIPHSGLCPQKVSGAPERKLDDNARKVLALCDGTRSIEDLARITGLGEFLATKAVYHLVQAKQVALHSAPKIEPAQVIRLVTKFNDVLQDIFVAVATYGGLSQSRATIDAWIVGSGYAPFFGEGVDDFGLLDANFVAAGIANVPSDRPLDDLQQALHELAAFALFSATTSLPREQELALARDINARLKSIRAD